MKLLLAPLSVLALAALCAGCAQMRPSTTEMGASGAPKVMLYCRDGAYVRSAGGCGSHGGVERDMSTAGG